MSIQHVIHGVDVERFVAHIRKGADLLKEVSSNDEVENIIREATILLFRQSLLGDKTSYDALYLLDEEKYERVQSILREYDKALNIFEKTVPDLAGSIPAEVTQFSVRRLFFALMGINHEEDAFSLIEHMWQWFRWQQPQNKIPASAFNAVFSTLMASENRDDALGLLKDSQDYIDWSDSDQQKTSIEAAMDIFHVFLSMGKYALAKRIITAMRPLIDYQDFLSQLETIAEENSEKKQKEVQENQQDQNVEEIQKVSDLSDIQDTPTQDIPIETKKEQRKTDKKATPRTHVNVASMVAGITVTEENVNNPMLLALFKAYGAPLNLPTPARKESQKIGSVPSGNDYPWDFQLPAFNSENAPMMTLFSLSETLNEILTTLVEHDGVRCLRDIPLTVEEFQKKFPRYSDDRFVKQITPIVIKVKRTLQNIGIHQEPINFERKQASFFQQKREKKSL